MKTKGKKLYFILLAVVGVIVIAANVVCLTMQGMLNKYTVGAPTNVTAEERTKIDADGRALAEEIAADGMVLLENNGTLPLSDLGNVNLFGWSSTEWVTHGSGSGGVVGECTDLIAALEADGVRPNSELTELYENYAPEREYFSKGALNTYAKDFCKLYELSMSDYPTDLLSRAKEYSDTAIVVIGRVNGESNDAPKAQYKYAAETDTSREYLELSAEEEDLLGYVGENYDKVVVLVNSTNAMELGGLKDIEGIDAVLVTGATGTYGTSVVADLLTGEKTPSGRLTDTYVYDFSTAASYANAGAEGLGKYTNGEGLYPFDGTINGNVGEQVPYDRLSFVDYAENIYVGYKWYETADAEGFWASDFAHDKWGVTSYDEVVQYPFGYGLSYAEFDTEILSVTPSDGALAADSTITVTARVTNTSGSRSGRETVQLYYSAPYAGGVEKSAVELADFAKTDVLAPGASEEVTLSLTARDMASYDCYGKSGHVGYVLEAGDYELSLRSDSHTVLDERTLTLAADVTYDDATNLFTGDDASDGYGIDDADNVEYMTRADFEGTFPAAPEDRAISDEIADFNLYAAEDAEAWIDESDEPIVTGADNGMTVFENGTVNELGLALGRDYDDSRWDALLDQLTVDEMMNITLHNSYGESKALPSIGKPLSYEADGPTQIGSFNLPWHGTGFPNPTTIAQTWDKELANAFGTQLGREADMLGYRGWYGPGCNLHRSPFGGRNYEYYSEDPVLSGVMTAQVARGSLSTGTYMYLKHFIVYDQETYRDGVYVWLTEQTLRETYARPFEIAVKEGGVTGVMTAYNRLGAVWAGGSHALLTELLRDEWGFRGAVLTDYSDHHAYMCFDQAIRAGGDTWMDGVMGAGKFAFETESATFMQALRTASKNLIYIWLNAYAQADAAGFEKSVVNVGLPWWGGMLIGLDVAYVLGFGLWGFFKFRRKKTDAA